MIAISCSRGKDSAVRCDLCKSREELVVTGNVGYSTGGHIGVVEWQGHLKNIIRIVYSQFIYIIHNVNGNI